MQGSIQFGRFIVSAGLLLLVSSCALGYASLRLRLISVMPLNKVIQGTVVDSVILSILVWKLSLILFEPVKFANNPMTLIYFSGGVRGLLLGLVVAAAYLIFSSRKQKISAWIYADSITAGYLAGTVTYNLINLAISKQIALFYVSRSLLALLLLIWQLKKFKTIGRRENLNQLLLWFSLGQILIFHFKSQNMNLDNLIWGFSMQQLLFYALAIIAISINLISGRKSTNQ